MGMESSLGNLGIHRNPNISAGKSFLLEISEGSEFSGRDGKTYVKVTGLIHESDDMDRPPGTRLDFMYDKGQDAAGTDMSNLLLRLFNMSPEVAKQQPPSAWSQWMRYLVANQFRGCFVRVSGESKITKTNKRQITVARWAAFQDENFVWNTSAKQAIRDTTWQNYKARVVINPSNPSDMTGDVFAANRISGDAPQQNAPTYYQQPQAAPASPPPMMAASPAGFAGVPSFLQMAPPAAAPVQPPQAFPGFPQQQPAPMGPPPGFAPAPMAPMPGLMPQAAPPAPIAAYQPPPAPQVAGFQPMVSMPPMPAIMPPQAPPPQPVSAPSLWRDHPGNPAYEYEISNPNNVRLKQG